MTQTISSQFMVWGNARRVVFHTRALLLATTFLLCGFGAEAQTYTRDNPYLTTLDVESTQSWLQNAPMELTD